MKFALFSVLFAVMASSHAFSPLMGNFKIVNANCGGEQVLWKKHDKVKLTGNFLVLTGKMETESENRECRFGDIYTRVSSNLSDVNGNVTEIAALKPEARKIECFDLVDGQRISEKGEVKIVEIEAPLTVFKGVKEGSSVSIQVDENELCQGVAIFNLDHSL